jgi:hypothetical protein
MIERDERPLSEIQFALDVHDPVERERIAVQIRGLLALQGVQMAQDIIEKGCTGLVCPASGRAQIGLTLEEAQFVRQNMAGSICGLPCYVPPNRFCLVHDCVGALQLTGNADGPQLSRHPEGIPLCSRELTLEEAAAVGAIQRKMMKDAADAAKAMGLEATASEVEASEVDPLASTSKKSSMGQVGGSDNLHGFVCSEHAEFNPDCRFCLAQAVAEGPFDPVIELRALSAKQTPFSSGCGADLLRLLENSATARVEIYVLAARWVRKLTRE